MTENGVSLLTEDLEAVSLANCFICMPPNTLGTRAKNKRKKKERKRRKNEALVPSKHSLVLNLSISLDDPSTH